MTNQTRRTICKIANYMTQKGASQSEAWKTAWKLYKQGLVISVEGTECSISQKGLQSTGYSYLAVVYCKGKYGNTYRKLQVRTNDTNIGFLPAKVGNIFKYTDTIPFMKTELYTKKIGEKFEAKVRLQIA